MNTDVDQLFHRAAQLPSHQQSGFLMDECADTLVRNEVKSLLCHAANAECFFDEAIQDVAASFRGNDEFASGDQIGAYRIVSLIGSGGMGKVYLAKRADGSFDQHVAIKVVRTANVPSLLDRFQQERSILGRLSHPNIARIFDGGQTRNGLQYLVMEYVSGQTIDRFCNQNHLEPCERLELFLKVCDAVRHAHQHLVIHRDLKPANIFVTDEGEPKLLDFGIAKVLNPASHDNTSTRLMTPAYASPEQRRGDVITTATDVYLLGAVLYELLTGRSPHADDIDAGLASDARPVLAPSKLNPKLPKDIDFILRKALRFEPYERYSSVEAFANDIRAFLEWQPIMARSGDVWYRTRKFLRRYRAAVAATTVTVSSLSLGLYMANHERAIAQRRFSQVRQLSNKVLALDQVVGGLHSSTRARSEIITLSKDYLESLSVEARGKQDLALEIGEAYSLLARAQGISIVSNLGQLTEAEVSLRKADSFVAPHVNAYPANRKGLFIAAKISHDRMILAEADQHHDEALVQARRTVGHLERLLALGALSEAESEIVSELFYDLALAHKNMYFPEDAIRYVHQSIEISRSLVNAQFRLSMAQSLLADLLRLTGHPEEALHEIREARDRLSKAQFSSEIDRRSSWFTVLWREGKILGAASGLGLNRFNEAATVLQKAFELVEEWSQNDREDAWSRLFFASVGRELGDLLTLRNPQKALVVYDHALLRLGEIKDNSEARRGEAEILARSAYALRRLNRAGEAKDRIDKAFRLLDEVKEYPADHVMPHTGADTVLRALGDHFGETGYRQRATEAYENLLTKMTASKADAQNDLRHAIAFSHVYGTLAELCHRSGRLDRAKTFSALRLELWRQWDRKLPANSLIHRHLNAARL